MMKKSTAILLTSLLGAPTLLAQKESSVGVSEYNAGQDTEGSSFLNRLFNVPDLKFGKSAGGSDGPGLPLASASYLHLFSADFDTLDGDISADEFSLTTPLASIRIGDAYIIPALTYRMTDFSSNAPSLLSEDTLHQIRMPIAFLYEPADRWIAGGMVMPAFSGDLSNSDNFSIAGAIGAGYQYSPELSIFGGVYYFNGFDESFAIPGLGFTWRPNDDWQAYFLGPFAGVTRKMSADWNLSLTAQYDSPTWNVEADNLGPDRDITMRNIRVGLKSEHRLSKYGWGYATLGYSFLRELEIEDLNSNDLQVDDIDAGFYLETGLSLKF